MTLRIDDIDWHHGSLRVCGKGRRGASLPLPQDAGDALLTHLTEARPDVPLSEVEFQSEVAELLPGKEVAGAGVLVVKAACNRAVFDRP